MEGKKLRSAKTYASSYNEQPTSTGLSCGRTNNIEMKRKNIPAQQLAEYVKNNEVAWQMCDSLMNFSQDEGQELIEEVEKEYEVHGSKLLSLICNAKRYFVFDPESDDSPCFEDLIDWFGDKDLLILVDNELLLCIAPCDKDKVLAMVV